MFFDLIRPVLCNHVGDWFPNSTPRRLIQCRQCSLLVDVDTLIMNSKDPITSIQLAYEFARLTGDLHVPCHFIVKINRILPNTIATKLSVILKSIELLKALNSPFITSSSTPPNRKLFQNLMTDYLDLFARTSTPDDKESLAIRAIVTQIKNAFNHVDFFDQYYNVLVPYVQSLAIPSPPSLIHDASTVTRPTDGSPIPILGDQLYRELERVQHIRNTYSKYCVAFDITYMTALCFLCGDDTDVLYNLTLDLSARLCTGYFIQAPVPLPQSNWTLAQTIQAFLAKHVTPTQNIQLYYHLQKFQRDEVEECFSEEFLKQFSELGEAVRKHIGLEDDASPILKYAYQQTYHYILFEGKDCEYYGFVMALAHYIGSTGGPSQQSRKLKKGVLGNCRKIYRFVKQSVLKIKAFENCSQNEQGPFFWTRDVLNVFLCADSKFERELISMLKTIVTTTEDLNPSTAQ